MKAVVLDDVMDNASHDGQYRVADTKTPSSIQAAKRLKLSKAIVSLSERLVISNKKVNSSGTGFANFLFLTVL